MQPEEASHSSDSPVIRPPLGLEEPAKVRLETKSHNGPESVLKRSESESQGSEVQHQQRSNAIGSFQEVTHEEMVSAVTSDLIDHK
eukprot:4002903-Amphidinium_carterae.2